MPDSSTPAGAPAEFTNDEHRQNHMAGLVRERASYEAQAKGHDANGDSTAAEAARARGASCADELKRIADKSGPRRGATR